MTEEVQFTALYNPETGMIACALLQAVAHCDYNRVPYLFPPEDWHLYPVAGMQRLTAKHLASMTREERVASYLSFVEQDAQT